MSAKIMGQVWDLKIPFNKAWVLLAMADHADHEGKNVFPSVPLIAWKTGYSIINVRVIIRALKADGILVEYARTRGGVKIYRIELSHVLRKADFVEPETGRPKGSCDSTPRKSTYQIDTPFSDTHNHQFPINRSERGELRVGDTGYNGSAYREATQNPQIPTPDFDDDDLSHEEIWGKTA